MFTGMGLSRTMRRALATRSFISRQFVVGESVKPVDCGFAVTKYGYSSDVAGRGGELRSSVLQPISECSLLVMEKVGANLSNVWHAVADEMDFGFLIRLLALDGAPPNTPHGRARSRGHPRREHCLSRFRAEWDRRHPDLVLIDF